MVVKDYNLYVMRSNYQEQAKQKLSGCDWYEHRVQEIPTLYANHDCPNPEEPEIKDFEKYVISLDITNPNLPDLYTKIQEVCPEFNNNKSFHLYWKYSDYEIFPISNYISYLSMISLIPDKSNNLYLVAREWGAAWLKNIAASYIAIPEDTELINMIAPRQPAVTAAQEYRMNIVKSAARTEYTTTYNPPSKTDEVKKGKTKEKSPMKTDGKSKSSKSKSTKKK